MEGIEDRLTGGNAEIMAEAKTRRTFLEADSYCWLGYARDMMRKGEWRIRFTHADNAPLGREVHWSQSVTWSLVLLAKLHTWAGEPVFHKALENGAVWFNPIVLIVGTGLIGWILFRWLGLLPALLFMSCLGGFTNILQTFHPLRPDHHSFQAVLTALAALCWARSGAGWVRGVREAPSDEKGAFVWIRSPSPPDSREARFWAAICGLCCGLLFWIGAVVNLPFFGALCVAGFVLQALPLSQTKSNWGVSATSDPGVWRWFGCSTAVTSLLMFLVEYFPGHLQVPLESNHPMYAVMAWAAGEAMVAWSSRRHTRPVVWTSRFILAALLALVPWGLFFFGDDTIWRIREPVHMEWLRFTSELDSWTVAYARKTYVLALKNLGPCFLAVLLLGLAWGLRSTRSWLAWTALGPGLAAAGYLVASWLQVRWMSQFSLISWLLVVWVVTLWWTSRSRNLRFGVVCGPV